jgi:hypothetical protein
MLLVALAADERSHGRAHHLSQAPRAPARRIGQAPGDPHPLPRPNRATWAGSPAASWPIAPKPNAPSNSPNTWAASTPPPRSWATTWPSLRKAFTRHGLGMPERNPEAVCQRAMAAASRRAGQPATPGLDRSLWPSTRAPSRPESGHRPSSTSGSVARSSTPPWAPTWLSSSIARATPAGPTTRAWAIIRRAERAYRHTSDRQGRGERRQVDRATRSDRTSRSHQPQDPRMVADAR